MLVYAMMLQDILGYDRMCQDMIGCTGRKRRRLGKLRAISQSDACIRSTTHTNKQKKKTTSKMTLHFDCTLSQTNSPQLTQTKRRRLAQWSLCTFLTVQTHTNKQPTPQTWRALWLYTLTKRCCTLLTVQTVHFWLYKVTQTNKQRANTSDIENEDD